MELYAKTNLLICTAALTILSSVLAFKNQLTSVLVLSAFMFLAFLFVLAFLEHVKENWRPKW
jgi:hypothetical protein